MSTLSDTLINQLITHLQLEDMVDEDFNAQTPLFEGGLELDSIDAIELRVFLEKEYGLKVTDPKVGRKVCRTIQTIADYIQSEGKSIPQ